MIEKKNIALYYGNCFNIHAVIQSCPSLLFLIDCGHHFNTAGGDSTNAADCYSPFEYKLKHLFNTPRDKIGIKSI